MNKKQQKEMRKTFKLIMAGSALMGLVMLFSLGDLWFYSLTTFVPILGSIHGLYLCDKLIDKEK